MSGYLRTKSAGIRISYKINKITGLTIRVVYRLFSVNKTGFLIERNIGYIKFVHHENLK